MGPFQANCFLVRSGEDVIVVDPGAEPERIAALLDAWEADPQAIVLTHAHVDHVGGVAGLVQKYGVPVYVHAADLPLYERAAEHGAMFGVHVEPPPPPDHWLEHGQTLSFGAMEFIVRHAPGHSPGGVVLVGRDEAFVGDCVFAGSIGRTDLPGGDFEALASSIRDKLFPLGDEVAFLCGHGPGGTIGEERKTNPFVGEAAGNG